MNDSFLLKDQSNTVSNLFYLKKKKQNNNNAASCERLLPKASIKPKILPISLNYLQLIFGAMPALLHYKYRGRERN